MTTLGSVEKMNLIPSQKLIALLLAVLLGGCAMPVGRPVPPREPYVRERMADEKLVAHARLRAVDMFLVEPGTQNSYSGGGSVLHEDGYILTCFHLAYGDTDSYDSQLFFDDGTRKHHDLLWTAQNYDLAIHKIKGGVTNRPAVRLGFAKDVGKDDPVLIVGTPGGKRHDVQRGIISRLYCGAHPMRPGEPSVATEFEVKEASVRGGHSGGPAFNAYGEQIGYVVIGIRDQSQLSFIRRVDMIRKAFNDEFMEKESRIGLKVDCTTDEATVTAVTPGSAAAKAGLAVGDTIHRFGTMRIESSIHCALAMMDVDSLVSDGKATLTYERNGLLYTAALRP